MSYPVLGGFLKGLVGKTDNPANGVETVARFGRMNELIVNQLRGKYGELTQRGQMFTFGVTAVTIPVVANNLVSVFGIYNPPGSGVDVELVDTEISQVLAATIVDDFAWFSSTIAASALATLTTQAQARSGRMQDAVGPRARVYSAVTHSGTPTKEVNISQNGATTATGNAPGRKDFEGRCIIPPGVLASVAASTAAGTASGLAIDMSWIEVPILQ